MKNKSARSNILPFFDAYRKKKKKRTLLFFVVKVHFINKSLKNLALIAVAYEQKDGQENKVKKVLFFCFFLTKYTKDKQVLLF